MVALSFMKRFSRKVEVGDKLQTIRAPWSNGRQPFKPGVTIQLWQTQRGPDRRRLGTAICTKVQDIQILSEGVLYSWEMPTEGNMHLLCQDGSETLAQLAEADGFESWAEMRDWFDQVHGLPFKGYVIHWRLVPPGGVTPSDHQEVSQT